MRGAGLLFPSLDSTLFLYFHLFPFFLLFFPSFSPQVSYCGYSIPHPSVSNINLRIQTESETYTALEALQKGLKDLMEACDVVKEEFISVIGPSLPLNSKKVSIPEEEEVVKEEGEDLVMA